MLDMFVIVLSLVLEVLFTHAPEGGLLILARSWRFARISHGIYESREDEHLEHLSKILIDANKDGELTNAYKALEEESADSGGSHADGTAGRHRKVLDPAITKLLIKTVGMYLSGHDPVIAKTQLKREAKALAHAAAAHNGGVNSDEARGLGQVLVPAPSHRFENKLDPNESSDLIAPNHNESHDL